MRLVRNSNASWLTVLSTAAALFALLALCAAPVAAQEPDTEEKATEESPSEEAEPLLEEDLSFFETTSVTATGFRISTHDIPAPVIVVPAERIERLQPDNAAELLRTEPGVDVNGTGPNQARPIIRGQRGHRILFLQDGLRMNNARRQTDFGEITGLVDVSHVETLELVRGAGSVLYGSDAIGGVLNLITKVPAIGSGGLNGSVGLRYGTAGDQSKIDGSISGVRDKFSWSVRGSLRDADNYDAPSGSFGAIRLDSDVEVFDTGIEDDSLNLYLGYRFNDQHSIFFRGDTYGADNAGFGYVDPALFNDPVLNRITYPFQEFDRYTLGYLAQGLGSPGADTFELKAYSQNNERDNGFFIDINTGPAFGPGTGPDGNVVIDSLIFSDVETLGFRGEVTKALNEKNLLTYGIEYYEDDVFNARDSVTTVALRAFFPISFICGPAGAVPTPGGFFECVFEQPDSRPSSPNADNIGSGIFAQNSFYATDRFTATLGLRYATSETRAKATPGWDVDGLDFDDSNLVGSLSLVYGINDRINLVSSFATAFRAPNIIERLFNGITPEGLGFQILNPDLDSEESENFDFGIKYQGPKAYFEVIYFDTEIDNAIIQYTLTDQDIAALPQDVQDEISQAGVDVVVQQRNAEILTIDGIEIAGGYHFDNGFSLGGNFTRLDGEAEVGGPAADPTGNTFSEKVNGWVRYDPPGSRWWAEYRVRHNGEEDQQLDPQAIIPPVGRTLPDFTIHNLAAGMTVWESAGFQHDVGLVINNLTDELYAEFSNASFFRPQPERNFVLTYRLRAN